MLNARERLILIVAVVLLGAICWKFFIYDPQQAARASLVAARDAAAGELAKNQSILARGPQVQAEYDRLGAFIAKVEAKLPTSKEIPSLLIAMEQLTHRLGIGFDGIRPGPLESVTSTGAPAASGQTAGGAAAKEAAGKPVPYSRMQVSLTISGSFAQVVEYLRQLRGFPRLIVVQSVSLSPQKLPTLGTSLTTEIYTLGATPGLPSGGPGNPHGASPAAPSGRPSSAPAAAPSGTPGGGTSTVAPETPGPAAPARTPAAPIRRPAVPDSPGGGQ